MTGHDHPPEGACPPTCPGWAEGALELFALQRRHADMLAACRAASASRVPHRGPRDRPAPSSPTTSPRSRWSGSTWWWGATAPR